MQMHIKKYTFNLPLIILTILFVSGLFGIGLYRIQIDSDIIGLLRGARLKCNATDTLFERLKTLT